MYRDFQNSKIIYLFQINLHSFSYMWILGVQWDLKIVGARHLLNENKSFIEYGCHSTKGGIKICLRYNRVGSIYECLGFYLEFLDSLCQDIFLRGVTRKCRTRRGQFDPIMEFKIRNATCI